MATPTNPVLVICGLECEPRIRQSVLPHLDFKLRIIHAHNKEKLLAVLASEKPALCVSEFFVSLEPVPEQSKSAEAKWNLLFKGMAGAAGMGGVPIYQIMPELRAASPGTKYVVACHNRHDDLAKKAQAQLKSHPEIIKVMGFINGLVNMRYLAKLFTKTFAGRQWHGTIGDKKE